MKEQEDGRHLQEREGLVRIESRDDVEEFLKQPTRRIAETLTGALADKGSLKFALGRLVQASIGGTFLVQLGRELGELQRKGRIKEDCYATSRQQASLLELLKFIEEAPDEEVFRAAKSIFLSSIEVDADDHDELICYELLKVCRRLKAGELLVLKTTWEMFQENPDYVRGRVSNSADGWLDLLSKRISLPLGLIEAYERVLIENNLLSGRRHPDRSGIDDSECRLTELGKTLCDRIVRYDLD